MRIEHCRFLIAWMAGTACLSGGVQPANAEKNDRNRASQIEAMTPEQKENLLKKKERFDALSPQEREKLRQLHAAISSQPNANQLQDALRRYNEWLKTLTTAQQAEVTSLPADKRIAKIKEIQQNQLQFHFFEVAARLEMEDLNTLNAWMEDFVSRRESEILSKIDSNLAVRVVSTLDPAARRKLLLNGVFWSRRKPGATDFPMPSDEDFKRLAAQLSPTLQSHLALQKTDDNRRALIMTCAGYAHFSRSRPRPPSDEELGKFYATLPVEERERLDRLDRRQMKWELTGHYWRSRFPGRPGGWRPPGPSGERGAAFGPPGVTAPLRGDGPGQPPRSSPAGLPKSSQDSADAKGPKAAEQSPK